MTIQLHCSLSHTVVMWRTFKTFFGISGGFNSTVFLERIHLYTNLVIFFSVMLVVDIFILILFKLHSLTIHCVSNKYYLLSIYYMQV